MELYILRHADAVAEAVRDADRVLSEKGREQVLRMGAFFSSHKIVPEVILTSPYPRAKETADAVGQATGVPVVTAPFLTSGMSPVQGLEELRAYMKFESVLLVGHQPDLGDLIATLLGVSSAAVVMKKASLALLTVDVLRPGLSQLEMLLPVDFV
jgi:phosphohistidine phosphatase